MSELGFRIAQSNKAFEILANNLYKDKILAVIRELSCNAYDAHVEAEIPTRPFEVHIPTSKEPYFSVRDYGGGLTSEQVEDIFTVFFESTKTGSSRFTGSFGLGAKTPFAIVNEFFVNSYQNGTITKYVCRRKGGIPVIECLDVQATTLENGLEIKFNLDIKSFDEQNWRDKAYNALDAFKIPPICNCKFVFSHKKEEYLCGNNWESLPDQRGILIQMGNVRYPLVVQMLPKLTAKYQNMFTHGWNYNCHALCLHIPQKSIEITPSREEISYDENTISFLENYLDKLFQDYIASIQDRISKCKYINEVIDTYKTLSSNRFSLLWKIVDDRALTYKDETFISSSYDPYVNIKKKIQNASSDVKEAIGDDSIAPFVFGQEIILFHSAKVANSFKKIKHVTITSKNTDDLTFPLTDVHRKEMNYLLVNYDLEVDASRASRIVAMHKNKEDQYDVCEQNSHVKLIFIDDVTLFCDTFGFDPSIVKNLSDFYSELGDKSEGTDKPTKRVKDERIYFKVYSQQTNTMDSHAVVGFNKAVETILELFKDCETILVAETSESVSKPYPPSQFKLNNINVYHSCLHVDKSFSQIIYPNNENSKVLVVRNTNLTNKILEKVSETKNVANVFVDMIERTTQFIAHDTDKSDIYSIHKFTQILNKLNLSHYLQNIAYQLNSIFRNETTLTAEQKSLQQIINADGIFSGDAMVIEFHNKFYECFGNSFNYFIELQKKPHIQMKSIFYSSLLSHTNVALLVKDYTGNEIESLHDDNFFDNFIPPEKALSFINFLVEFINYIHVKYKIFVSNEFDYHAIKKILVKLIENGKISVSDCV